MAEDDRDLLEPEPHHRASMIRRGGETYTEYLTTYSGRATLRARALVAWLARGGA